MSRKKGQRKKSRKIDATIKIKDIKIEESSKLQKRRCKKTLVEAASKLSAGTKVDKIVSNIINASSSSVVPSSKRLRSRDNFNIDRTLKCDVCYLEFSTKYNLHRHNERFARPRYPCDKCGTKFPDKKQLESHVKYAHTGVKDRKSSLECQFCGQIIIHEAHLQAHVYHYHNGGAQIASKISGIVCEKKSGKKVKISVKAEQEDDSTVAEVNQAAEDPPRLESLESAAAPQCTASLRRKFENDTTKDVNDDARSTNLQVIGSPTTTVPQSLCNDEIVAPREKIEDRLDKDYSLVMQHTVKNQEIMRNNEETAKIDGVVINDLADNSQPKVRKSDEYEVAKICENYPQNTLQDETNLSESEKHHRDVMETTNTRNTERTEIVEDNNGETSRNDIVTKNSILENIEQVNTPERLDKFNNHLIDEREVFVTVNAEQEKAKISLADGRERKENEKENMQGSSEISQTYEDSRVNYASFNAFEQNISGVIEKPDNKRVIDFTTNNVSQGNEDREKSQKNNQNGDDSEKPDKDRVIDSTSDVFQENSNEEKSRQVFQNGGEKGKNDNDRVIDTSFNSLEDNWDKVKAIQIMENGGEIDETDDNRLTNNTIFQNRKNSDNPNVDRLLDITSINVPEKNDKMEKPHEIVENRESIIIATTNDIPEKFNNRSYRRKRTTNTKVTHLMPKVAKVTAAKKHKLFNKRGKKPAVKLNAVLAEVAALFLSMDVKLPEDNYEMEEWKPEVMETIEKMETIDNKNVISDNVKNFDPICASVTYESENPDKKSVINDNVKNFDPVCTSESYEIENPDKKRVINDNVENFDPVCTSVMYKSENPDKKSVINDNVENIDPVCTSESHEIVNPDKKSVINDNVKNFDPVCTSESLEIENPDKRRVINDNVENFDPVCTSVTYKSENPDKKSVINDNVENIDPVCTSESHEIVNSDKKSVINDNVKNFDPVCTSESYEIENPYKRRLVNDNVEHLDPVCTRVTYKSENPDKKSVMNDNVENMDPVCTSESHETENPDKMSVINDNVENLDPVCTSESHEIENPDKKSVINDNGKNDHPVCASASYGIENLESRDDVPREMLNNNSKKDYCDETKFPNMENEKSQNFDDYSVKSNNRVNKECENPIDTINTVLDEVEALLYDESINFMAENDEKFHETSETNKVIDKIDDIRVINETSHIVLNEIRMNDKSLEILPNSAEIESHNRVNNETSLSMSERNYSKSYEISQNCEKTDKPDNTRIINESTINVLVEKSDKDESLEILQSIKIIDKSDKMRIINETSMPHENSEIYESEISINCHKMNNPDDTRIITATNTNGPEENSENNESLEIVNNCEKTDKTDNAQIMNVLEENCEWVKSSEMSQNCDKSNNPDDSRIINKMSMNVYDKSSEKYESEILQNCEKIDNSVNTKTANVTTVAVSEENVKKSESNVSVNCEKIDNSDNTKIANVTTVAVSEENVEKPESNVSEYCEKIDNSDNRKIANVMTVTVSEKNVKKSESNVSENCEKIDNSDNTKIANVTTVAVSEENINKSELNVSENCEKIDNPDNPRVIDKTSIDVPEENSEHDKLEISKNFEKNCDKTRVINETVNMPEKTCEKDKSSGISTKCEKIHNPEYTVMKENIENVETSIISKNCENIEEPDNVGTTNEMIVNVMEENSADDVNSKISDSPAEIENNNTFEDCPNSDTSSDTSESYLQQFADEFDDIMKDTLENDRIEALLGKSNEFERDNELRELHECKLCYVKVTRITTDRSLRKTWNSSSGEFEEITNQTIYPSPAYWCILCCVAFSSEATRRQHLDERHTIISSLICDKIFTSLSSLRRHYRELHNVGCDDNETCVCGKHMHSRDALDKHFYDNCRAIGLVEKLPKIRHDDCQPLPKTNACPTCERDFWLKSCLDLHRLDCKRPIETPRKRLELPRLVPIRTEVIRRKFGRGPIIDPNERVCRICRTEFVSSHGLLKHEEIYASTEHHSCNVCGTIFSQSRLLKGHIKAAHTASTDSTFVFHCAICNQGFTKRIHRHIHMTHVHGEKYPESSSYQPLDISNVESRNFHLPSITDTVVSAIHERDKLNDLPGGECPICLTVFTNRKRLIDHVIYYKFDEEIKCNMCNKTFAGQHSAHRHNKLVHYTDEIRNAYPHCCAICHEGFMYEKHLLSHLSHMHEKPTEEIDLTECESNCDVLTTAKDRASEKIRGSSRLQVCLTCEMTFTSVDQLAAHQMDYENNGTFVCTCCSKKCRTATQLLDHLSLNHTSFIHDSVKCRRCDEIFLTTSAWMSHVKHSHPSDSREPSEFYLETNVASSEQFGVTNSELVPANYDILSGATYALVRNKLDEILTEKSDTGSEKDKTAIDAVNSMSMIEIITIDETKETLHCHNRDNDRQREALDFNCHICGVHCRDAIELARHNEVWADEGLHMCEKCGRRFTSMTFYEEHKKKHYRCDSKQDNFCSLCNEGFDSSYFMKIHMAHIHKKTPDEVQPATKTSNPTVVSSDNNGRMIPLRKVMETSLSTPSQDHNLAIDLTTSCDDTVDIVYEKRHVSDTWRERDKSNPKPPLYSYECLRCRDTILSTIEKVREHHKSVHGFNILRTTDIVPESMLHTLVQQKLDQMGAISSSSCDDSVNIVYDKMADSSRPRERMIITKRVTYVYKCPDCPVKYPSFEKLWLHHRNVHRSKRFGETDKEHTYSTITPTNVGIDDELVDVVDESTSDEMKIVRSKRKIDEILASDSTIVEPSDTNNQDFSIGTKRFRIVNNTGILPLLSKGILEKIDKPKTPEPIDKPPASMELFMCNICDLTLNSRDSLFEHKDSVHEIREETTEINGNPVEVKCYTPGNGTIKIMLRNEPQKIGSNIVIPVSVQRTINSLLTTQPAQEVPKKVVKTIIHQKVSGITTTDTPALVPDQFRCLNCNIVFTNASLLEIHEANVHSSAVPGDSYIDVVNSNGDTPTASIVDNSMNRLRLLVNTLPALSEKRKDESNEEQQRSSFAFEPVMVPIPPHELEKFIKGTGQSSLSISSDTGTINERDKLSAVNLDPSNCALGKLKIRSVASIIGKTNRQYGRKRNYEPVKRSVPVNGRYFDSAAYEELCRQHNLDPNTKSRRNTITVIGSS